MTTFATDFHATPEELIELVGKWMTEYPIVATACAFPPSSTSPVTLENFRQVLARPDVWEVIFTEGPVKPSASSNLDILDEHPGALCLQIYHVAPRGLEQARLTTMDANPMWKKINRELKKLTTAGATLLWEDGRSAFDRNARFTAGAKALAASGVPLRQFHQSTFVYQPK
ncbi:MAG: hypothetical protein IPM54_05550 [Polyangiaceae bacterium]|nr:hypothetical protein [Polyangiaceae bacterium]